MKMPFGTFKGEDVRAVAAYWLEALRLRLKVWRGNREVRRRIRNGQLVRGKDGKFYAVTSDGSRRKLPPEISNAIAALMEG